MVDVARLKALNLARWKVCKVNPALLHLIDGASVRLVAAKPRYQAVEAKTAVPWAVVAVMGDIRQRMGFVAKNDFLLKCVAHDPVIPSSVLCMKSREPLLRLGGHLCKIHLFLQPPHAAFCGFNDTQPNDFSQAKRNTCRDFCSMNSRNRA